MREDQYPVRVTSKTGKKGQGESNDSEKRKKIRPSEISFLTNMTHKKIATIQNFKESHCLRSI